MGCGLGVLFETIDIGFKHSCQVRPYGEHFYVYCSDRFFVDADTLRMHMVRSWAIRWVKSAWVKGPSLSLA